MHPSLDGKVSTIRNARLLRATDAQFRVRLGNANGIARVKQKIPTKKKQQSFELEANVYFTEGTYLFLKKDFMVFIVPL